MQCRGVNDIKAGVPFCLQSWHSKGCCHHRTQIGSPEAGLSSLTSNRAFPGDQRRPRLSLHRETWPKIPAVFVHRSLRTVFDDTSSIQHFLFRMPFASLNLQRLEVPPNLLAFATHTALNFHECPKDGPSGSRIPQNAKKNMDGMVLETIL